MLTRTFTVIGAGGIFACGLLAHLAREGNRLRRELSGTRLRLKLLDIDDARLHRTVTLGKRVLAENGWADQVILEPHRREEPALDGTDLVLLIRPFHHQEGINVEIARRHGVAGGHDGPASLGLGRLVLPEAERLARQIQQRGTRQARLIVFPNPTGILAQAVEERTGLATWGWCGAPDGLHDWLADIMQLPPARITRLRSVGVNHFAYVTELDVDGRPGLPLLREISARNAAGSAGRNIQLWMEWTRDTGWPYLTAGHPAPWNHALPLQEVWLNPEAPPMYEAIDRQLVGPRVDLEFLLRTFGWEGTTGLAMANVMGALWGTGALEVGWQSRHDGAVPGIPPDCWLEHTQRIEQGRVGRLDFRPLPDGLEAQLRLLAVQYRDMARALVADDRLAALQALALNPFSCPMESARPYVNDLWKIPLST